MRLDRKLVFQRLDPDDDAGWDEPEGVWEPIATEWAERRDVSDGEKFQAGLEVSTRLARFKVRWNSVTVTLTGDDRFEHEGAVWDISGVKELEHQRWLEITAKRRSD